MKKDILELEKILEQEINACSQLEKYISEKKDFLIKGDIENLIKTDIELEKYNSAVKKLDEKRIELNMDENPLEIKNLKQQLKEKLVNIEKQNNINDELIKHALKIIESSVLSITKVLVPESTSYNNRGEIIKEENTPTISSIIHEA